MEAIKSKERTRQRHSTEFKAQVLAECSRRGASIAAIAQAHGLHANLVYKWRRDAHEAVAGQFVALPLPAANTPVVGREIHIEVRRSAVLMTIRWPTCAASDCAAWLREVLG